VWLRLIFKDHHRRVRGAKYLSAWFTRLPIKALAECAEAQAVEKDGKPPSKDLNHSLPGDESPG
jgi:hypothetical protein